MMNTTVIDNYSKLKPTLFFLPVLFLLAIVLFLYSKDSLSVNQYIEIQKECFYYINSKLSQFPNVLFNFTQLGDALISLSILSIFLIYAPKMWEALISGSIVSAIFSGVLKNLFAVPRPAAILDHETFTIIGRTLMGHSSLPSGHSITIFTMLTVVLFAFMPKNLPKKFLWVLLILMIGFSLIFTRVGMGAHYPLDVITGGFIGYISGLSGIFISRKYKIWNWIQLKKFYPVFITLFAVCSIIIIIKITQENLIVFYFALASLAFSLYKIIFSYAKK